MEPKVYVLKVSLLDVEPAVWRRFTVPPDISLDRLHDVVQIVMGWQNYHLHRFEIKGRRFTEAPENPEEEGREGAEFILSDMVDRKGARFDYLYDFGAPWEHTIEVEDTKRPVDEYGLTLLCLEGQCACPPEDIGGPEEYRDFREALQDPGHPEHEECARWYESLPWHQAPFDPDRFDPEKINFELARYLRWSRPRKLPWNHPF